MFHKLTLDQIFRKPCIATPLANSKIVYHFSINQIKLISFQATLCYKPYRNLGETDRMYFIIAILAHMPITTLTSLIIFVDAFRIRGRVK